MMENDLRRFDGMSFHGVVSAVRARGYNLCGTTGLATVALAHPGDTGRIVRITRSVEGAAALAAVAATHAGNPYLPRIDAFRVGAGDEPVAVTVMERLHDAAALPESRRATLTGIARAAALLPEGEDSHADAHRYMLKNNELRTAVIAIAEAIAASIAVGGRAALYYDAAMDPALPRERSVSAHVLFRAEGPGWRPVFADPFRSAPVRDEAHRAALARDAAAMWARLGYESKTAIPPGSPPALFRPAP